MKKIITVICLLMTITLFSSCTKEVENVPQDVTFTLGYQMGISSREMTRANGSELYTEFYENYIKTKEVGYPSYTLTFYKDDKEIATFNGEWDATLVTLPEGTYTVKGSSKTKSLPDDYSKYSLLFDETITITKNQTTLTLNPIWDCYCIFFESNVINEAYIYSDGYYSYRRDFSDVGTIKYVFLGKHNDDADIISYTTIDNDSGIIKINQMGFENGKYYFLDKLITTYEIPPMDSGF